MFFDDAGYVSVFEGYGDSSLLAAGVRLEGCYCSAMLENWGTGLHLDLGASCKALCKQRTARSLYILYFQNPSALLSASMKEI